MPQSVDADRRAEPGRRGGDAAARLVEVAIDAAGGGGARTYTYARPGRARRPRARRGRSSSSSAGARRSAVVLGDASRRRGIDAQADRRPGPQRRPAAAAAVPRLARWIADHYLAPPALVIRAMLPPGLLERLELVAERPPADDRRVRPRAGRPRPARPARPRPARRPRPRRARGPGGAAPAAPRARGPRPADARLDALGGRARAALRALDRGSPPTAATRPRAAPGSGRRPAARSAPGRGARRAAGAAATRRRGVPAADARRPPRHATLAGLARRGLVERRGPGAAAPPARRPTAGAPRRPAARRAADRPQAAAVDADPAGDRRARPDAAPPRRRDRRRQDRDLRRGDRRVARGGPAGARPRPGDRPRACRSSTASGRTSASASRSSTPGCRTASAPTSGGGSGPATSTSSPGRGSRSSPRSRDVGLVDRRRGARGRLQERPDAAAPGPRRGDPRSASWPARRSSSAARRRRSTASAAPATGAYRRVVLPTRPTGRAADGRGRRPPRGAPGRQSRAALRAARRGARGAGRAAAATRRSSSSTAAGPRRSSCAATAATSRPARTATGRSSSTRPATTLRCHHCGRASPLASRCPNCALAEDQVPRRRHGASRARGPASGSRRCGSAASIATSSSAAAPRSGSSTRSPAGQLDVLVGTSLVAKGLDVPNVTLVGVVSADVSLNLPDERAAERTYQLLAQAVGRAGRGDRPGPAIIQSYQPEHPAIRAVADDDAAAFYDAELELRRRFGSPPFGRLVKLTSALEDRDGRGERRRGPWPTTLRRPRRRARQRHGRPRPRAGVHRPPRRPLALERRPPRERPASRCSAAASSPVVGRRRPGVAPVSEPPRPRARRPRSWRTIRRRSVTSVRSKGWCLSR